MVAKNPNLIKSYLCKGDFNINHAHLKFNVIIFSFTDENNLHFILSPQLDISVYGKTELEAKESFEIHAEEFFKYTIKNNTLNEVLSDLGWDLSKEKPKVPPIARFMRKESQLVTLFEKYPVVSQPRSFDISSLATA